jgi:hypothetical protein
VRAIAGELDAALTYEGRALKLDPGCVPCLVETAGVFYDQRRFSEALQTATLARGLSPVGAPVPGLAALLEKARRRADEAPLAKRKTAPKSAVTVSPELADPPHGRIQPEAVQKVVRASFGPMRECYEEGLRRNCDLQGRVVAKFVIDRDGSVAMVGDAESDLPDPAVVACVLQEFEPLRFPAPEGGRVTVVYPIHFSPGD